MNKKLVWGSSQYKSVHRQLPIKRGKACELRCVNCNNQAKDWAWIHDTDPLNIFNYQPMCQICHRAYDGVCVGEANGQSKLTETEVIEIRSLYASGAFTHRELADKYNVGRNTIYKIVNRLKWKSVA